MWVIAYTSRFHYWCIFESSTSGMHLYVHMSVLILCTQRKTVLNVSNHMYMCVYVCICVFMYMCLHYCVSNCVYITILFLMYIQTQHFRYASICVCMYVSMFAWIYMHTWDSNIRTTKHLYVCACMYPCLREYICIHGTQIYAQQSIYMCMYVSMFAWEYMHTWDPNIRTIKHLYVCTCMYPCLRENTCIRGTQIYAQ